MNEEEDFIDLRDGLLFLIMLHSSSSIQFKKEINENNTIDILKINNKVYNEDTIMLIGCTYLTRIFHDFTYSSTLQLMRKRELIGGLIKILNDLEFSSQIYPFYLIQFPSLVFINISCIETPSNIIVDVPILKILGKEFQKIKN